MNKIKIKRAISSLSCVLTLSLIFQFVFSALPVAAQNGNSEQIEENVLEINGEELAAFAAKYDTVETLTGDEAVAHNEKVNDIIFNDNLSAETKRNYLAELGVFEINREDTIEFAASSEDDVALNKPTIKYDSLTKQYIITATGNWKNHNYEVPTWSWWYPSVGDTKNIGGADAIGISLTNTSGSTAQLAINSGYGKFYNGTATKQSTTLATEDDNYGGGFTVQDFIKITKVDNYVLWCNMEYYYNAYNMTCVVRYNNYFKNYNGNAKLFYSHTWDNTSVTSVSLSKTGAGLGWSKSSDRWIAYSYARTFAKGTSTN